MREWMMWLAVGVYLLMLVSFSFSAPDPHAVIEALMDESLRSNRVQACDGERVTLQCPKNTHIQVETGFYGRVVPISQLCPERDGKPVPTLRPFYDSTCDVIHAQSRLSELCDKRRKCTIFVDATTFQEDPCPATSKYLQMSYKCRPVSFDGESFCGGTEMQLECREGRRLAVYSAAYGRTPRGQPAHCQLPPKHLLNTECTRDVLWHVLSRCHAQPGCSLSISDHALGRVCPAAIQSYLNIIFMCVNEEVFSEEAIKGELKSQLHLKELQREMEQQLKEGSGLSMEEGDEWKEEKGHNIGHQRDDAFSLHRPPTAAPTSARIMSAESIHAPNDASFIAEDFHMVPSEGPDPAPDQIPLESNAIDVAHDIALIWQFLRQNKEKVLLCTVLSLSLALIFLVLACLLQQFCPGRQKDHRVRYSIERSTLINRSNQLVDVVGGAASFVEMGDLADEPFMRYSLSSPPRSSHYDFT